MPSPEKLHTLVLQQRVSVGESFILDIKYTRNDQPGKFSPDFPQFWSLEPFLANKTFYLSTFQIPTFSTYFYPPKISRTSWNRRHVTLDACLWYTLLAYHSFSHFNKEKLVGHGWCSLVSVSPYVYSFKTVAATSWMHIYVILLTKELTRKNSMRKLHRSLWKYFLSCVVSYPHSQGVSSDPSPYPYP